MLTGPISDRMRAAVRAWREATGDRPEVVLVDQAVYDAWLHELGGTTSLMIEIEGTVVSTLRNWTT